MAGVTGEKWDAGTWKTPQSACLNCGWVHDAASLPPTEPEPRGPRAGDVAVCIACSHIAIYKADGTLRQPTGEELAEAADSPEVLQVLEALRVLRKSRLWRRGVKSKQGT